VTAKEIQPNIDKDELVKLLGGEDYEELSYSIRKKLTMWNEKLDNFLRPRLLYSIYKIKSSRNALVLENNLVLKSTKLSKVFRGCSNLVCFLVTIGNVIEEEITSRTSQNRSSDAYILDAMGSVLVEDMAAKFHRRMEKKFQAEGKAVTIRLSPGYCDWLLEEQKKIFSLLDAGRVGIELTDSYLMKPRKSISGIFGIMPSTYRQNHPLYNPCSECEKIYCIARRDTVLEKEKELLSS
jgi:hypothetical protein